MSTILSSQTTNDDDTRIGFIIKATTPYRRKAFAEKLHALHSMDKTVATRVKIVEIIPVQKSCSQCRCVFPCEKIFTSSKETVEIHSGSKMCPVA